MIYLGIDIGGTSIKCGFVNEAGSILKRFALPIFPHEHQEDTIKRLSVAVKEGIQSFSFGPIQGIGIGCPGTIDSFCGVCTYSNNLKWSNLPICELMNQETGLSCKMANDANAQMLGEARFGIAKNYSNLVLLTLGTGVGGGLYLNHHLYEGNEGKGAELGHMVIKAHGRACTCGRRGCLEAYCSATALIRDTKQAMNKTPGSVMWKYVKDHSGKVDGMAAFECAKMGDKAAQKVIDSYIGYLGEGILNFINIFRPDAIVFSGGLSAQKEALLTPLRKYLEKWKYGFGGANAPKAELLVSNLGNDAGIIGAASLAMPEAD
jgi:glucokinase